MENKYFKEIMEALKEISVDQAVLKSQVETHLKQTTKLERDLEEVQEEVITINKTVGKQEIFMKVSIWVYGLLFTAFSYKLFKLS